MNWAIILVALLLIFLFLRPLIKGAVFFPTLPESVKQMVEISKTKSGDKVIDLGSGDGRILLAFAKKGIEIHGYEINLLLVLWSKHVIKKAGLEKLAFVHWESFWKINFSSYNTIIVYGIPYIMKKLKEKIQKETIGETRIISNVYSFPEWEPVSKNKSLYLYKINKSRSAGNCHPAGGQP
jgi:methylase of polypeptide subunit release factors